MVYGGQSLIRGIVRGEGKHSFLQPQNLFQDRLRYGSSYSVDRFVRGEKISSGIQGSGSRVLDPESWIQGPGSRVLDPGSWIQGPGSRVLNPGSWIQGPGSRVLDLGSWIQLPGSWIQGTPVPSCFSGSPTHPVPSWSWVITGPTLNCLTGPPPARKKVEAQKQARAGKATWYKLSLSFHAIAVTGLSWSTFRGIDRSSGPV